LNPKPHKVLCKVSKDSDVSLASNKNLSDIRPSTGLGQGPDEVGQKGLKQLHLLRHSQNNPKTKYFFHCKCEDLPNLLRVWTAL